MKNDRMSEGSGFDTLYVLLVGLTVAVGVVVILAALRMLLSM